VKQLFIVAEGPTEQTFINDVLGPALNGLGVYPTVVRIGKPGAKFGDVSFLRARRDIEGLLRNPNAFVTTLFDFYGLGNDWPGFPLPANEPLIRKAGKIESAAWEAICHEFGDHPDVGRRLWVYLQMHEFEGLLFSDPVAFANGIYRPKLADPFARIRNDFRTPEHINGDPMTAPSKRILRIHPEYEKPVEGTLGAIAVGLQKIRRECSRFNDWVSWMEAAK